MTTSEQQWHRLYRRNRYRNDPEYRENEKRRAKAVYQRNRQDPLFRELATLRKRICDLRESCAVHEKKAQEAFKQLTAAIKKRDEICALRKKR